MNQPILWVSTSADRALFKVTGKGSFQNSRILKDAGKKILDGGSKHFCFDLSQCLGMDSTFLGTLASLALRLRQSGGEMTLCATQGRNLELIENMGLDKLLTVSADPAPSDFPEPTPIDTPKPAAKSEVTQTMIDAHKTLIQIDSGNESKFKDVVKLLEEEAASDPKKK